MSLYSRFHFFKFIFISLTCRLSIVVIIVGNGIDNLSSNPEFHFVLMSLGKA